MPNFNLTSAAPVSLLSGAVSPPEVGGVLNQVIENTNQALAHPAEGYYARLRRYAASAANNNAIDLPPLTGTLYWRGASAWASSTPYTAGAWVTNSSTLWYCCSAGTSGATPPGAGNLYSGHTVSDGSLTWLEIFYTANNYVIFGGLKYIITVGGLPGSSSPFSSPYSLAITDGTATLSYVGPQDAPRADFAQGSQAFGTFTKTYVTGTNIFPDLTAANPVRLTGGIPSYRYNNGTLDTSRMCTWATTFYPTQGSVINASSSGTSALVDKGNQTSGFDFILDGPQVEFNLLGCPYEVLVDGRYLGPPPLIGGGSSDLLEAFQAWYCTLDFSGIPGLNGVNRKGRQISVEFSGGNFLSSIKVATTSSIQRPMPVDADQFAVPCCGDSLFYIGAYPDNRAWPNQLGKLMGWPNVINMGLIGDGYLATNGGQWLTYRQRLINDLISMSQYFKFPCIVIQGSRNDTASTPAAVTAEAVLLYQAIRKAGFMMPIIVIGFVDGSQNVLAANVATENAVGAAVAQWQAMSGDMDIAWFPLMSGSMAGTPAMFGTGHGSLWADQGATGGSNITGDGNNDFYISSDSTHPTNQGHRYLAKITYQRIMTWLGSRN